MEYKKLMLGHESNTNISFFKVQAYACNYECVCMCARQYRPLIT